VLPIKFRFIWPSNFREEDFLEINQPEKRIAYGSHLQASSISVYSRREQS
jgi:hypothetical protein